MPQFVEPAAVRQKRNLCCGTTGLQSSFFLQADRLSSPELFPYTPTCKMVLFFIFFGPKCCKIDV